MGMGIENCSVKTVSSERIKMGEYYTKVNY